MSQTAQTGYLALAPQTAKGTPATVDGTLALLVTSNSLSGSDRAPRLRRRDRRRPRRRLLGRRPRRVLRVRRPSRACSVPEVIGYLLLGAGFTAAAPVQDAATGAYTHTFTPANTGTYLSILSRWGSTAAVRRFSDCLVSELSICLDAGGKVTWSASFVGVNEEIVAGVTPTFETGPVGNYEGSAVVLDTLGTYRFESVGLAIANNLSDDEWVIGSRKLDDVTFGNREVTMTGTVKVGTSPPRRSSTSTGPPCSARRRRPSRAAPTRTTRPRPSRSAPRSSSGPRRRSGTGSSPPWPTSSSPGSPSSPPVPTD